MMLNAKQHSQLANYIRQNRPVIRDAGRTIANPASHLKRADSFLTLAKMTAHTGQQRRLVVPTPRPR